MQHAIFRQVLRNPICNFRQMCLNYEKCNDQKGMIKLIMKFALFIHRYVECMYV